MIRRPGFDPWFGKIPWRRAWQPTPVFLPGESQGQRNLVGYNPWGCRESDMTEQLTFHFTSGYNGEPLGCFCLVFLIRRVACFRLSFKQTPSQCLDHGLRAPPWRKGGQDEGALSVGLGGANRCQKTVRPEGDTEGRSSRVG